MKKNKYLIIDIILGLIALVFIIFGILRKDINDILSWNVIAVIFGIYIIIHYYQWRMDKNKKVNKKNNNNYKNNKTYKDSIYYKKKK
ncbi:MAG: hypothetical protein LBR40_05230 [Bacilli bacterium]|jgi:uncharacterized membrane protein|nr:hypothetical protein [Bacilli bacterium]